MKVIEWLKKKKGESKLFLSAKNASWLTKKRKLRKNARNGAQSTKAATWK